MATLRKDGRYEAKKQIQGRRYRGYGHTQAEANADLSRKIEAATCIHFIAPTRTLLDQAATHWYPRIEGLKKSTRDRYTSAFVRHIRPALGHLDIDAITKTDVQRFVNQLASKQISPNGKRNCPKRLMDATGVRYVYGVLCQVFLALEDVGAIQRSPCKRVKLPPRKPKRDRFMEPSEAAELIESLDGHPLRLPVFLALVLGLRRAEICGLQWSDLSRQNGTLRIRRNLKTTASKRTLKLPVEFVERIDAWGDLDSEWICTYGGSPWRLNELTRVWSKWKGKPEGFTFHDLRHCAAGLLYAATRSLVAVRVVLGQANVDVTLGYIADEASSPEKAIQAVGNGIGLKPL